MGGEIDDTVDYSQVSYYNFGEIMPYTTVGRCGAVLNEFDRIALGRFITEEEEKLHEKEWDKKLGKQGRRKNVIKY